MKSILMRLFIELFIKVIEFLFQYLIQCELFLVVVSPYWIQLLYPEIAPLFLADLYIFLGLNQEYIIDLLKFIQVFICVFFKVCELIEHVYNLEKSISWISSKLFFLRPQHVVDDKGGYKEPDTMSCLLLMLFVVLPGLVELGCQLCLLVWVWDIGLEFPRLSSEMDRYLGRISRELNQLGAGLLPGLHRRLERIPRERVGRSKGNWFHTGAS